MTHVKAVRSLSVVALAAAALTLACGLGTQEDPTLMLTGTESEPLTVVDENGVVTLECPDDKIIICHIPPGNPANEHTICVGSHGAQHAHEQNHGDTVGYACAGDIVANADAGTVEQPTPEADAGTVETGDQDAGTVETGDQDGGSAPVCAPVGEACTTASDCCTNQCVNSVCAAEIG